MKQQTTMNRLVIAAAVTAMFATIAPLQASEADNTIESTIKETYVFKTYLKDDAVKARAEDGTVTLTGIAQNAAEKSLVEKLVSEIRGVSNVKNKMTVKDPETK